MNRVSILIPAAQQGDELRMTVASARESIGDLPHEIIVVDDQSTDGSTRDLPRDVLILRPPRRLGCSGSRRLLQSCARGAILAWADPHCRFPGDALKRLALAAENFDGIVQPMMRSGTPGSVPWYGSNYAINERGITVPKATRGPHPVHPALYGSVFAARKDVLDKVGGWPPLPGFWGCYDTFFSLLLWACGVPVLVLDDIMCVHNFSPNRRFPFSTVSWHHAANAHWFHKCMFPESYETYWRPHLLKHPKWSNPRIMRRVDRTLKSDAFAKIAAFVAAHRLPDRTEAECFRQLLNMEPPQVVVAPQAIKEPESLVAGAVGDEHYAAYVKKQTQIAPGRVHKFVQWERLQALNWLCDQGEIKIGSVLDVGPRDGFIMGILAGKGAASVKGLEISPPAVEFAKKQGLDVAQGDVRQMPYLDKTFDLVTCLHVLEHVPEPEKALAEMWRVVKPGGWLLVVVPREKGVNGRRRGAHYSYFPKIRVIEAMANALGITNVKTATGIIKNKVREIRFAAMKEVA